MDLLGQAQGWKYIVGEGVGVEKMGRRKGERDKREEGEREREREGGVERERERGRERRVEEKNDDGSLYFFAVLAR